MIRLGSNDKSKDILNNREIKIYRTLYLIAGIITPIFSYIWTNFHSKLSIISIVASILSVYYISIYFLSYKNKFIKQRIHHLLYASYYFVSAFVIYIAYENKFSEGYSLLLMLVIFYIILTFNKLSDLKYYLISTMVLIFGALFISQLQNPNTNNIIIVASFVIFSIIAVFNLYLT
jgi:hypothetical protein